MAPDTADAIVVGAGVIGCAIAYGLASRGHRVLAVDKLPAAGYGSTSSSSAVIRTYYSTLESTHLAWEALHHWRDWPAFLAADDERGHARFLTCGSTVLRTAAADGMERLLAHHRTLGIPVEEWDAPALAAKAPWLDTTGYGPPRRPDDPDFGAPSAEPIVRAAYFPDSGYVSDPQLAAHNLQMAAAAKGAAFRFNAEVAEIRVRDGRAAGVRLAGGEEIAARVVVNAGGPWSGGLNRLAGVEAGMRVRTRPMRQEVAYVPRPRSLAAAGEVGLVADADIGTYCRTDVGGKLLIGSLEPACDPVVWVDDPDSLDRSHTDQWTAQVWRQGLRMPDLEIPGQAGGVVDLYDVSDDWTPIYDRSDLPGFYMACGTSGNQFKNAPAAGQLMAGLIGYCEAGGDHDRTPYRFPCRYTGGEIDTGAFSRRRDPSANTGTVLG